MAGNSSSINEFYTLPMTCTFHYSGAMFTHGITLLTPFTMRFDQVVLFLLVVYINFLVFCWAKTVADLVTVEYLYTACSILFKLIKECTNYDFHLEQYLPLFVRDFFSLQGGENYKKKEPVKEVPVFYLLFFFTSGAVFVEKFKENYDDYRQYLPAVVSFLWVSSATVLGLIYILVLVKTPWLIILFNITVCDIVLIKLLLLYIGFALFVAANHLFFEGPNTFQRWARDCFFVLCFLLTYSYYFNYLYFDEYF